MSTDSKLNSYLPRRSRRRWWLHTDRDGYIWSSLSSAVWVAKQALSIQQLPARIYIALCYFPVQLNSTSNWGHWRWCVI